MTQESKEHMNTDYQEMSFLELDDTLLFLDVVFPPVLGDPDTDLLIQKLNQAGISGFSELNRYSPEELEAKSILTKEEVDAIAEGCTFLRTKAWHRRRKVRLENTL